MRIAILYPPFAQIVNPEDLADYNDDRLRIPFGLLSIAAQAMRDGHDVSTFNITDFPWPQVETLIRRLDARVFGMYCNTPNRHGVGVVARLIREIHPGAHIVVGGPHVSALPLDTLRHHRAIDTVVVGEGEETFMELLARLQAGESTAGIAGTAWQGADGPTMGPPRALIKNLDGLASPLDYFHHATLITSRGCPAKCTFCGTENMWHGKLRFHSVDYVLDRFIEPAIRRHGMRYLGFKDDTFTASRKRILGVCRGIMERNLDFVWTCDTRVDCLDEEVLHAMRMAGCQSLSLGVESASRKILANIRKRTDPETILEATRMAKKFGFFVRYYMIYGNRGETMETFQESLDFIEKAKPNRTLFHPLTLYPGTEEFELARKHGIDSDYMFSTDAQFVSVFAGDARGRELDALNALFPKYFGTRDVWDYGAHERAAILGRLDDRHAAHADLAKALIAEERMDEAEIHARRALDLGYPDPGLIHNMLARIAAHRGDMDGARRHLEDALDLGANDAAVHNLGTLEAWLTAGGAGPLVFSLENSLGSPEDIQQPNMPGPIRLANGDGETVECHGVVIGPDGPAALPKDPDPFATALRTGVWEIVRQALARLSPGDAIAVLGDETARFAAATTETLLARDPPPVPIACGRGCDSCCRAGGAMVTPMEILRIADFLGGNADAIPGGSGCPLLVDGACSVHPVRPLQCRARNSVDVEACRRDPGDFRAVPSYVHQERVALLALDGLRLGLRAAGMDAALMPLAPALATALGDPDARARWLAKDTFLRRP